MFNGERDQRINYADVTISIPPDSARKIGDVQIGFVRMSAIPQRISSR